MTLAPLIPLTIAGLPLINYAPTPLIPALLFGLTTNIAGSVGDLAVAIWLLRKPAKLLVQDLGDSIDVFW